MTHEWTRKKLKKKDRLTTQVALCPNLSETPGHWLPVSHFNTQIDNVESNFIIILFILSHFLMKPVFSIQFFFRIFFSRLLVKTTLDYREFLESHALPRMNFLTVRDRSSKI